MTRLKKLTYKDFMILDKTVLVDIIENNWEELNKKGIYIAKEEK